MDKKIKASIPFLKGRTVLLVEDSSRPIPVPDRFYWEALKADLRRLGYRFIYIPELLEEVRPQMADYLFPGYEVPDADAVCRLIREMAGIGERSGLLYKLGRSTYFRDLTPPAEDFGKAVRGLMETIYESSRPKPKISSNPGMICESRMSSHRLELPEYEDIDVETEAAFRFSVVNTYEEELDERTISILTDVQRLLNSYKLSKDDLRTILGYKIKLSRLKITRNGNIFLTDYLDYRTGQPKEVKMDTLTRMVYFFYLRHPEGVRIKELGSHIDELMHLYMGITGRDDKDAIRASILGHVDPYKNNTNVSMSRIRGAFKDQVDESIARYYSIEGIGGDPYSIALDRDYVIWEYD